MDGDLGNDTRLAPRAGWKALNVTAILLIASLFTPAFRDVMIGSGLAETVLQYVDKGLKALFLYGCATLLLLRRRWVLSAAATRYFAPMAVILVITLLHLLFSQSGVEALDEIAAKEFTGIAIFTIVFVAASNAKFDAGDYRLLAHLLTAYGLMLSALSIWHSGNVEVTDMYRKVGDATRAGTGSADPNMISAVLNICSMAALGLFLTARRVLALPYLLAFLGIQYGRLFTFSTGGLVGILVSLLVLLALLAGRRASNARGRYVAFLVATVVPAVAYLVYRYSDTFLYRALLKDEYAKEASVLSRLDQYVAYFRMVAEDPSLLFFGTGTARLPALLGRGVTLHNSFLRSLATGGLAAFAAFNVMYLTSFRDMYRSLKAIDFEEPWIMAAALFAAFAGWTVQAATLPYDYSIVTWFFVTIAFSLRHNGTWLWASEGAEEGPEASRP